MICNLYVTISRDSTFVVMTFIAPLLVILALPAICFILRPDNDSKLDIHIGVMQAFAVFNIIIADKMAPFTDEMPIFGMS